MKCVHCEHDASGFRFDGQCGAIDAAGDPCNCYHRVGKSRPNQYEMRNDAIEDAARIVEQCRDMYASDAEKLAAKIRCLKTKESE